MPMRRPSAAWSVPTFRRRDRARRVRRGPVRRETFVIGERVLDLGAGRIILSARWRDQRGESDKAEDKCEIA